MNTCSIDSNLNNEISNLSVKISKLFFFTLRGSCRFVDIHQKILQMNKIRYAENKDLLSLNPIKK